ncbi:hypothetical protein GCM10009730_64470 [Streptomyces albidochromogenes]
MEEGVAELDPLTLVRRPVLAGVRLAAHRQRGQLGVVRPLLNELTAANVQAFFHPTWLTAIWYGPWVLTGALLVAWAACRADGPPCGLRGFAHEPLPIAACVQPASPVPRL